MKRLVCVIASTLLLGGAASPAYAGDEGPSCAPGVYVAGADGEWTPLKETAADHRKVSGIVGAMFLGPLGGNKMKVKTVLAGPQAGIKVKPGRPEFRFCFAAPNVQAAVSAGDYVGVDAGPMTPRDFQLIRFDMGDGQREVALSSIGGFGGPKGELSRASVPFETEQTAPGVFRVIPTRDIGTGEYGFLHAVTAAVSARKKDVQEKAYDFSVTE